MKKAVKIIASVLVVVLVLFFLTKLLEPKYVSSVVEGRLIAEYYEDEYKHNVLFVGDCEVYENFSPQVLWDEYGINSFIRGSAQQLIWQSYYLLEDSLRYEKPDVVVFNILSLKYNEPQKEAYNRMSIEGMKWSMSKVRNIQASMMEDESFLDYVFPILRYHARITELSGEDFEYLFKDYPVSHNGYYMRVDVKPAENVPTGRPLADYRFGDNAYKYLDMMTKLCKDNGIELVLIKAPSLYPYWYPEWEEQMEEYAAANNLKYINFLELTEEVGLDFNEDTYDAGLHLNLSGAEKLSSYFGQWLVENCDLQDLRSDSELSKSWDEKRKAYENERDTQLKNLELYGTVK